MLSSSFATRIVCRNTARAFSSVSRKNNHKTDPTRCFRRYLSSSEVAVSSNETAAIETATKDVGAEIAQIARHGKEDGIITLNVGGKEFITLRSTVQMNPILWNHVTRAEANQEFTKGAIFIDRDSTHFGLILQHLRNRADSITQGSSIKKFFKKGKNSVTIQIPQDAATRRDFFLEARYFQIKEIEDVLCSYDVYTQLASFLGGGAGNPFLAFSDMLKNARRMLLATGGTGIFMGTMNEDLRKDVANVWKDLRFLVSGEKPDEKKELPSEPSFS